MSAAAEFMLECQRRGVSIWQEEGQICIGGPPSEVRAMEASLLELRLPLAKLVLAWNEAKAPLSREMH